MTIIMIRIMLRKTFIGFRIKNCQSTINLTIKIIEHYIHTVFITTELLTGSKMWVLFLTLFSFIFLFFTFVLVLNFYSKCCFYYYCYFIWDSDHIVMITLMLAQNIGVVNNM